MVIETRSRRYRGGSGWFAGGVVGVYVGLTFVAVPTIEALHVTAQACAGPSIASESVTGPSVSGEACVGPSISAEASE
jgi:hypothetical protein